MQILVESIPPEPPPEESTPPPVPPEEVEPAEMARNEPVATRVGSDEAGDEILMPSTGEQSGSEQPAPESSSASFSEWVPNSEQAAELAAMNREIAAESRALNESHSELRKSIVRMQVSSAAKDFIANSDGGSAGAIRLLNLEGYTTAEVMPVLQRYGFTYERRHITPSAGRSFLNAAVTDQGVYTNQQAEGVYDVLVHSSKSISIMTTREVEALARKGYDPARSRVIKVVFGIVRRENGQLDLDVTDLTAEQIR